MMTIPDRRLRFYSYLWLGVHSPKVQKLGIFQRESWFNKEYDLAPKLVGGCCDSHKGFASISLRAFILLTLGAPLPSEGHYGQMAELLVLQPGLTQAFSLALG